MAPHERGGFEKARVIFAEATIDSLFQAQHRIALGQQRRRHMHQGQAAQAQSRHEPGDIACEAASQRHHDR